MTTQSADEDAEKLDLSHSAVPLKKAKREHPQGPASALLGFISEIRPQCSQENLHTSAPSCVIPKSWKQRQPQRPSAGARWAHPHHVVINTEGRVSDTHNSLSKSPENGAE